MATPTETSENPGMAPPPQQSPAPLPQPPQRPESLSQRASRVRRVPFPILPTRAAQIGQVADPSEMLKAALYSQLRTASSLNPSNPTENGIVVLDNGEIVELKPPQNLSRLQASQEVAQYYQKFGAILWHHIFDFQDEALAARYDRQEAIDDLALRQESLNFELDCAQAQVSKWKAEAAAWKMKYNLTPSRNQPAQCGNQNTNAPIQGPAEPPPTPTVMKNTQFVPHAFTTKAGRAIASTSSTAKCAPKPTDTSSTTANPRSNGPPTGVFSSPARKPTSSSHYSQNSPHYYHTQPTVPGTLTHPSDKEVILPPQARQHPRPRTTRKGKHRVESTESPRVKGTQNQRTAQSPKQPPAQNGDTTETDSDLAHGNGNDTDTDTDTDGDGDGDDDGLYISNSDSESSSASASASHDHHHPPPPRKRARYDHSSSYSRRRLPRGGGEMEMEMDGEDEDGCEV